MKLKTTGRYLIIATAILSQFTQSGAQAQNGNGDGTSPGTGKKHSLTIDERVKHQYKRIDKGLKEGKLTEDQANKLRAMVIAVESDIKAKRKNGQLNPEDKTQIENTLKQNGNLISTALGAGTSVPEGEDVLGPEWKAGKDGAQDPKKLLKQMKAQESRQLRQEKQNMEQIMEQQQLDYQKQVIYNLGQQKSAIQKKKKELENVRNESGAN